MHPTVSRDREYADNWWWRQDVSPLAELNSLLDFIVYEELHLELENPAENYRTFNAHVWLTFPNYGILDVVLPAALCGDRIASETPQVTSPEECILFAGPEMRRKRNSHVTIPAGAKDGAFIYRDVYGAQKKFTYQPMIVGHDFLIRSGESLQEHWEKFSEQ